MKKKKHNEIIKVIVVSALSIGIFSATFIAGNQVVLSSATSQQLSVPLAQTAANMLPHTEVVPENYPFPNFTVVEHEGAERSMGTLSPEKAAELGARYIWEVLGEDIDGKTIYMRYETPQHTSRTHWSGLVTVGAGRESVITFNIDGINGERISISDNRRSDANLPERNMTMYQLFGLDNVVPENIEFYTDIARVFAQSHFSLTSVTDVRFERMQPTVIDRGDRDAGDLAVVTYRERALRFTATDERGRQALVIISMDTHELHQVSTQRSDVVPGFEFRFPETHIRGEGGA